ncbi:FecR family protein [Methylomonas methanica]|uniref:Anti-FecI sigma factor, FecR n=1 Tax=Methylomonas methanica (strain DSM 25384 / MC09) TaxID=857087 RepID=G0A7R1_METMM|nr:FecR domain-containing protein [Methylomonas methanica]AEG01904.1 anti-FecI sigma factor, FecR [Methylomonas methanica MC09]
MSANARQARFSSRSFKQAVTWFVALQSQDCDAAKRAEFQHWLERHATHPLAYAEAERLWGNLDPLKSGGLAEVRAARQAGPQKASVRAALSVLLAALLGAGWWLDYRVEPVGYATDVGQRQSIRLADGSSIELNAVSRLSVKLSWCRRSINLLEGEALFNVAHETLRPFTVQADGLQIRDIGTRFTVRARADAVRVAVLEGEVSLKPEHDWLGQSLTAGHSRQLDSSRQLQAIETSDSEREASWADGRLVFDHTPLAEVVAELERHHPVRFVFADPALARQTLSGSFEIADLQPFLRALETMLPVRAVRKKQTVVLLARR